jgi:hypothetical protein
VAARGAAALKAAFILADDLSRNDSQAEVY